MGKNANMCIYTAGFLFQWYVLHLQVAGSITMEYTRNRYMKLLDDLLLSQYMYILL